MIVQICTLWNSQDDIFAMWIHIYEVLAPVTKYLIEPNGVHEYRI